MSFGDALRKASSNEVEKELYEKLKPVFSELANSREKGCELVFQNVSDIAIDNLFNLIRDDDITVDGNKVIWDKSAIIKESKPLSSPCTKCSFETQIACCGCPKYYKWEASKDTVEETVYDIHKKVLIIKLTGKEAKVEVLDN